MKKTGLLALILLLSLLLVSCGEYTPAIRQPDRTGEEDTEEPLTPEEEKNAFTVSLEYQGKPFVPKEEIDAQWTDGFTFHKARIGEDGTAKIGKLDGDYRVTLSHCPEGYAYDPNGYRATNDARHVTVELQKIRTVKGTGGDLYANIIELKETGVYRTELKKETNVIFYQFVPQKGGVYTVESWVDCISDTVNPLMDVYIGSFANKYFSHTLDSGAWEGSYTKNFRLKIEVDESQIGSVYAFGIKATAKDGNFPKTVDFAIKLNGEFALEDEGSWMVPTHVFDGPAKSYGSDYQFVGAETDDGNGHLIFDGSRYGLNEEDGYYHVFNEATGKFDGPVLYAMIDAPCRFLDAAFTHIEDAGNNALNVQGKYNYKQFIYGFSGMVARGYFCDPNCPCYKGGTCQGGCPEGCETCLPSCTPCPEELLNHKQGYGEYCNSDGAYYVTEELKTFLQRYSISQRLYFDGNGWVETNPNLKVDAKEEDQWLFACGFYVKK